MTANLGITILYQLIHTRDSDYRISALVKNECDIKSVHDAFPNMVVIRGHLESSEVFADAVTNADVVIRGCLLALAVY